MTPPRIWRSRTTRRSSTFRRSNSSVTSRSSAGGGRAGPSRQRQPAAHATPRLEAALEIDRAEQRLERRREDRPARPPARLLLAPPHAHERAEVELGRPAREPLARYQLGPAGREDPDGCAGVGGEQVLRDDEPERSVAEERQRLVIGGGGGLGRGRGGGEGALEGGPGAGTVVEPAARA